jgi:uncharacterized protein (DUF736 family)
MEIKNNKGSIFKNDYKTKDSHPDYKGKMVVDGVSKDIALWFNQPEGKKAYFSVAISDPYKAPEQEEAAPAKEKPKADELPW